MKVRVEYEHFDYGSGINIRLNDKQVFSVFDGEPEDNNLGRNFNDCYSIPELLKQAYEAGKNGETLELEEVDSER